MLIPEQVAHRWIDDLVEDRNCWRMQAEQAIRLFTKQRTRHGWRRWLLAK